MKTPYYDENWQGLQDFAENFENHTEKLGENGLQLAEEKFKIPIGRGDGQHFPPMVDRMASALPYGPTKKRKLESVMRDAVQLGKAERLVVIGACRGITCCSDELKLALGQSFRGLTGTTGAALEKKDEMILCGERLIHELQEAWAHHF